MDRVITLIDKENNYIKVRIHSAECIKLIKLLADMGWFEYETDELENIIDTSNYNDKL